MQTKLANEPKITFTMTNKSHSGADASPDTTGLAILFADDPLFRHFWYSGFQLYTNAIVIGPSL